MIENKTACFTWRKRILSQGHQNTIESDKKKIYKETKAKPPRKQNKQTNKQKEPTRNLM